VGRGARLYSCAHWSSGLPKGSFSGEEEEGGPASGEAPPVLVKGRISAGHKHVRALSLL